MSSSIIYFSLFYLYLVFSLIGFGPALFFFNSRRDCFLLSVLVSPCLGFALTSVVGTYLVFQDLPVSVWTLPWICIMAAVSLFYSIKVFHQIEIIPTDRKYLRMFYFCTLLVLVVLLTPLLLGGGLDYTILRGNGSDSFNYVTLAGYLQHEPFSHATKFDSQQLLDIHPTYNWAKYLLNTRWTSSALLAFSSSSSTIPIINIEYIFSLFSFLVSLGPIFAICRAIHFKNLETMLLASSTILGFWASFVLDIRALSQITSIPIILFLVFSLIGLDQNILEPIQRHPHNISFFGISISWTSTALPFKEILLSGLLLCSLIFLYIETIPMVVFGILIFLVWQLFIRHYRPRDIVLYSGVFFVAILLIIPYGTFFFNFFHSQIALANSKQLASWHIPFFSWLYKTPLTGFWGLTYFSEGFNTFGLLPQTILKPLAFILGILCTLLLFAGLIEPCLRKKDGQRRAISIPLINSFLFACLLQFVYFVLKKEFWIAGKGLAFGFYFFPITALAFCAFPSSFEPLNRFLPKAKKILLAWMAIQIFIGFSISFAAVKKNDYAFIKQLHDQYRRHDWDFRTFRSILNEHRGNDIWVFVTNDWVAWYLQFALAWENNLINLNGIHIPIHSPGKNYQSDVPEGVNDATNNHQSNTPCKLPDFLLLQKGHTNINLTYKIEAENRDFYLIKVTKELMSKSSIIGISNPNGMDGDPYGPQYFWVGGPPTRVKIIASTNGDLILKMKIGMGPCLPGRASRNATIINKSIGFTQDLQLSELTERIIIKAHKGYNEILFICSDKPELLALPNGDTRPLMFSVSGFSVE